MGGVGSGRKKSNVKYSVYIYDEFQYRGTIEEIAIHYGVTEQTVLRWKTPYYKNIGGKKDLRQ